MDAHQRMQQHAALRRDFADARPANLARDVKELVERHQDAQDASLAKRLLLGSGSSQDPSGDSVRGQGNNNPNSACGNPPGIPCPPGFGDGSGNGGGVGGGGGGHNGGGGNGGGNGGGGNQPAPVPSTTPKSRDPQSTKTDTAPATSSTSSTDTRLTSTRMQTSTTRATLSVPTTTSSQSLASFVPPTLIPQTIVTTPTPTPSLANATADTGKSSGPGAGPIIGIVAGALVGVAVLSALVGFIWKKCGHRDDPYEANPFDKDEFRRHSAMLPETFDDEDGEPSMMEQHAYNSPEMYQGPGVAGMGVMAAGAGALAADGMAHNESGGPRPPTMFQRHINGPAAQYDANAAYAQAAPMPPAAFDHAYPQLPPMAFGGNPEAFGAAGVAPMANIANPYAHLDRGMHDVNAAGGSLDRTGSNGSHASHGGYGSAQEHQYVDNTAGRPSTAEGRSGTPDLPNVQQTYAAQLDEDIRFPQFNSPPAEPVRNPFGNGAAAAQAAAAVQPMAMHHDPQAAAQLQHQYSVRNLVPNQQHGAPQHLQPQQRPMSTASEADPDDAYGGVW